MEKYVGTLRPTSLKYSCISGDYRTSVCNPVIACGVSSGSPYSSTGKTYLSVLNVTCFFVLQSGCEAPVVSEPLVIF